MVLSGFVRRVMDVAVWIHQRRYFRRYVNECILQGGYLKFSITGWIFEIRYCRVGITNWILRGGFLRMDAAMWIFQSGCNSVDV